MSKAIVMSDMSKVKFKFSTKGRVACTCPDTKSRLTVIPTVTLTRSKAADTSRFAPLPSSSMLPPLSVSRPSMCTKFTSVISLIRPTEVSMYSSMGLLNCGTSMGEASPMSCLMATGRSFINTLIICTGGYKAQSVRGATGRGKVAGALAPSRGTSFAAWLRKISEACSVMYPCTILQATPGPCCSITPFSELCMSWSKEETPPPEKSR
mmetsp:Transcript_65423/g.200372  ORF Transcript_65423/g.200372 Transcript_65423/m.200372 type:complete len:209 (+) Transcript_65423:2152-2778(+)